MSNNYRSSIKNVGNSAVAVKTQTKSKSKVRIFTTASQLLALEHEFAKNQYISRARRAELALDLNMEYLRVRVWFRNRRLKEKVAISAASNQTVDSPEAIQPVILPAPKQPVIAPIPEQPVISLAPNPSIFGTLPHLMNGLPTADLHGNKQTEDSKNWNNWNYNCSNNTNSNGHEPLPPFSYSFVGPMPGHNDFYGENYPTYPMPSSNISSNNYEFDYFRCSN